MNKKLLIIAIIFTNLLSLGSEYKKLALIVNRNITLKKQIVKFSLKDKDHVLGYYYENKNATALKRLNNQPLNIMRTNLSIVPGEKETFNMTNILQSDLLKNMKLQVIKDMLEQRNPRAEFLHETAENIEDHDVLKLFVEEVEKLQQLKQNTMALKAQTDKLCAAYFNRH